MAEAVCSGQVVPARAQMLREMPRSGLVVEAVAADVSIPRAIVVVVVVGYHFHFTLAERTASTEEAREELTTEHRD